MTMIFEQRTRYSYHYPAPQEPVKALRRRQVLHARKQAGAMRNQRLPLRAWASMRETAPMLSSSTLGLMPPEGLLIHEPTFL
jgi:hypothetical protein